MRQAGLLVALVVVLPLTLGGQAPQPSTPETELAQADRLMADGRYRDAVAAYRRALAASGADLPLLRRSHAGLVLSLLRTGDFAGARDDAERVVRSGDADPRLVSLYGDTLWAAGLFEEAERTYDEALKRDPLDARAHHGRARAMAARSDLDAALTEAREAVRLDPAEAEFHHTVGVVLERAHRYDDASAAFREYVSRLPHRDSSERALWTRAEIRVLDSFHGRTPIDTSASGDGPWEVPLRIEKQKVLVQVRVNGGGPFEFVLDTGAEQTVLSRDLARRRGVVPITYMESAGVGDVGLRGLQVGRIDRLDVGGLQVTNVPCLIKNPPLGELPAREPNSFSPLALGLSMRIDYARRRLVIGRALPPEHYATELPLRLFRLATVRGSVNGQPASFAIDTGGEVISIGLATAREAADLTAFRRIPLKVYGISGWDKEAFLLPNVDLAFSSIRFTRIPVVVLNLTAPSVLLGFQLGGIVGHQFLSHYVVSIDLNRSVVGLDTGSDVLH